MRKSDRGTAIGAGTALDRSPVALRRLVSVLGREGPVGMVRMLQHGVRWRYRRLVAGSEGGKFRLVSALRQGNLRGTPITATVAVAAAETTLGGLRIRLSALSPLPEQATVGVVIPAYRDAAFLGAALQSVSDQTYRHWRCIVVDDASPEDVGGVVRGFESADPRITLVRHAANGGLPAARNTGVRHLDTDMVVFLDADDLLVPDALERAVACFTPLWCDHAVAGVHGQVVQVPEEADLAEVAAWKGTFPRSVVDWASYQGECPFNVHAVVLRRELVDRCGGFDESLRDGAEDWDLWFRLLRHGYRFEPNDYLMGAYRQHRASMIRQHQALHLTRAATLFDAAEEWAALDPSLVVGRGAPAPLSRSRLAHERAKRAAAVIGMQITGTGSLDPLTDSEAFDLLDLVALSEGRQQALATAAINGAARGLGMSRATARQLSPMARDKLERIGNAVAEAILERPYEPAQVTLGVDATSRRQCVDIVLAAESAADVVALARIASQSTDPGRAAAVDLELLTGNSGATAAWHRAGIEVIPYGHVASMIHELTHLIVCSPTGPVTADLLRVAERAGVRCHVVRVPGRMGPLSCSSSNDVRDLQDASEVMRAVQGAPVRKHAGDVRQLYDWRGSEFASKLPLEDGPLDAESIDRLEALRNRHLGETAVIIGNGPSLNDTELEILTDVPTFGVNAIFLAADRFPKPISYYVVEDTMVFRDNRDAIKAFKSDWKIFPAMYRSAFDDSELNDRTIFFRMNAGFYDRKSGTVCHPRFSLDATQRLYCGQSVTIINLQLAHWMGFKRVVLIGMDFSYRIPDDADRRGGRIDLAERRPQSLPS